MTPKYRVTEKSFVNNVLVDEGATVDYEGAPGVNLEPLNAAAVQAKQEAAGTLGVRGISVGDMARQKVAVIGGDPEAVDAAQAASAASAAAAAALQGQTVSVDNKPIELPAGAASAPAGAEGLV